MLARSIPACLVVATVSLLLCDCSGHSRSASPVTLHLNMTSAPQIVPSLSDVNTPIPSGSISDDQIDAHIPAGVPRNDRIVIRKVMAMLPAGERAGIVWFRVPPGRSGYEQLPNHGLIVEYIAGVADYRKRVGLPMNFDGEFVLYYDGHVQPDSNLIFSQHLDRYLTATPQRIHILHRH